MSEVVIYPGHQESSPRSTILVASAISMTTALPVIINEKNMVSDDVSSAQGKIAISTQNKDAVSSNVATKLTSNVNGKGGIEHEAHFSAPPTPISHEYPTYLHYSNPTHTPQTGSGYYVGYLPQQAHMIPDPDSPGGSRLTGSYDVGSFFQAHAGAAFHPATASQGTFLRYGPTSKTPLSPPRGGPVATVTATPSSPLFPRASSGVGRFDGSIGPHHGPPNIPYMASPPFSSNDQLYLSAGAISNSSDEGGWNGQTVDSRNHTTYPHTQSMQMHYGMSMTRATSGGRAYSFDETMLPPSALDDQVNPAYSPYGGAQESPTGAPGFVPQLSWGYGGPPDPYGSPTSPLQPRPTVQIGMIPSSPVGGMRLGPAGPYGQNYPATSPGHPIQTTASNKGPDGANLFIFHIPNHYTNVDMYHLFLPYGNLLSVRIMVERETGRSRGFGFVSYDTPEAAAMAIKELNGFPIGNKRLKVQHKQIRRHNLLDQDSLHDSLNSSGNFQRYPLPPSGANASQSLWFDPTQIEEDGEDMPQHRNEVEEVIVIATEREVDDPAQPNAVLEIKSNIVEPTGTYQRIDQLSPLATIGQLQNTLPDIPGNDEDPQE